MTGTFVGGFSSQISGGSFTEGFTVAGLNHALHTIATKIQFRDGIIEILEEGNVNSQGTTEQTPEAVLELTNRVPTIKEWYELGGNPEIFISSNGPKNALGQYFSATDQVAFYSGSFKNNYRLAAIFPLVLNNGLIILLILFKYLRESSSAL